MRKLLLRLFKNTKIDLNVGVAVSKHQKVAAQVFTSDAALSAWKARMERSGYPIVTNVEVDVKLGDLIDSIK
jgi:hypothetical protein